MKIDILTTFTGLDISAKRGGKNAGGGMACLMNAATSILSERYCVNTTDTLANLQSDFVVLDAIFLVNGTSGEEDLSVLDALEADAAAHPDRKYLLWCAEKMFLRYSAADRERMYALVDAIAVTDPYLYHLFQMVGVTPLGILCDAIDPNLFRPAPKELVVTAVGGLKHIKNIDWLLEVFTLLEGKIRRIYVGGVALWSDEDRPEDRALVEPLRACVDTHYEDVSVVDVAFHNSYSAIAINDTWHDCSSRANEELLMSGVVSVHGQHPLFAPRPGFTVVTPQDAYTCISEITKNFTEVPDRTLSDAARAWACQHVSADRFRSQFEFFVRSLV